MGKIRIWDNELLDLLEDHSGFRAGFIDKQTGEIVVTSMLLDTMEEEKDVLDKIEHAPDL